MDLNNLIDELYADKEKIEGAIASLMDLQRESTGVSALLDGGRRRGRKSMGLEERQEVSERMRRYWEGHRKQRAQAQERGQ